MDGFTPLTGALASTPQVQAAQATQRAAQIRRDQNRLKVSSIDQDTFERQVESADAIEAIHDKPDEHPSRRQKREPPKDEKPEIDFTA